MTSTVHLLYWLKNLFHLITEGHWGKPLVHWSQITGQVLERLFNNRLLQLMHVIVHLIAE